MQSCRTCEGGKNQQCGHFLTQKSEMKANHDIQEGFPHCVIDSSKKNNSSAWINTNTAEQQLSSYIDVSIPQDFV